jgi:hypothetical protein
MQDYFICAGICTIIFALGMLFQAFLMRQESGWRPRTCVHMDVYLPPATVLVQQPPPVEGDEWKYGVQEE